MRGSDYGEKLRNSPIKISKWKKGGADYGEKLRNSLSKISK
ncbi:hypothetical protein [Helcococcus ovis]|nr:hypothetical protein [Helcococcus ovis]